MKKDNMMRNGLKLVAIAALLATVSACSSNDTATTPPPTQGPPPIPPPPTPTGFAAVLASLGTGFAAIFQASNTAEPRNPVAGDVVAPTSSSDPINF